MYITYKLVWVVLIGLVAFIYVHMFMFGDWCIDDNYTSAGIAGKNLHSHSLKSLGEIQDVIWKQIKALQEHGNCEQKMILRCKNTGSFAGLGSTLLRYAVCLQIAYGLNRVVLIEQKEYEHFGGVFHWLKNESRKCGYLKSKYNNYTSVCNMHDPKCYLENGFEINNTYKVLEYNSNRKFPAPRRIPGTIPPILEKALTLLKVDTPWLWFTSQFLGYILLRPNKKFANIYNTFSEKLRFKTNIVGMHVRRGDKLLKREAPFIHVKVYYNIADKFYNKTFSTVKSRKLYVASDDKNITKQFKLIMAPNYEVIRLPIKYLEKALKPYKGYAFPKEVLESMLLDIYFLTYANFTICTFSSNICRIIYSLKLSTYPYRQHDRIISLVGSQYFLDFYSWFGYDISSANTYLVSVKGNPRRFIFPNGKTLLKYNKGQLFERLELPLTLTVGTTLYHVIYVKTLYNNSKGRLLEFGYVFPNDMDGWPGKPIYYQNYSDYS